MTPPPSAGSIAARMRPVAEVGDSATNNDVIRVFSERPGVGWLMLVLACRATLAAVGGVWLVQIYTGLGIAG